MRDVRVIIAGRLSRKAEDRDQTGLDSQERESVRWAESHGHEVAAVVADFKSGRSGLEARPNLRPWVTDPGKLAEYDAIVALKVDRLTRGDRAETAKLEQWAREHGKALLITGAEVRFPSEGNDGIQWDLMLRMAHQEWLNTSERYRRMQRTLRDSGSFVGRPPWGFAIVKRDGRKILEPTATGRKCVPVIFQMISNGKGIRAVAAYLTAETGKRWNEGTIGKDLIRNPVYYGARRNAGTLETEALVTFTTWQAANAALVSRARPGRGTVVREKVLVNPICGQCYGEVREGCPSGKSPMYRLITRDGEFFRCTGQGPLRQGCGAPLLKVAQVEADVTSAMLADEQWHIERVFVPGNDTADAIARLRETGAAAMRDGNYAAATDAMRQAEDLESEPSVAPHWEDKTTDQTEAAYFASLDREGQRDYLRSCEVVADRDGVVIAPRAWVATA